MASTAVPQKRAGRRRVMTRILLGFLAFLGLLVAGFLIWANTGVMEAEPGSLAAVENGSAVSVTDHKEAIVLSPAEGGSTAGFVFIPGAKVAAEDRVRSD